MRFPCHSTAFLLVCVCRLQTMLAGLLSTKVSEEVATEIAKKCRRRQPHCRLTPPCEGTPANIRTYLIFLEIRIIERHYAADSMGLSSFNFFLVGSVKRICAARMRISRSRSSKVINFGRNRKCVCDFLLVHVAPFQIYCRFTPLMFHPNFWGVPVAPDRPRWGHPEHEP